MKSHITSTTKEGTDYAIKVISTSEDDGCQLEYYSLLLIKLNI